MRCLRCISPAKSRDHCMYHGSSSAACSGGNMSLWLLCCCCQWWGYGGLLRERVCPSARRLIEHGNWAAKEEVSKKQTKRKHTSRLAEASQHMVLRQCN